MHDKITRVFNDIHLKVYFMFIVSNFFSRALLKTALKVMSCCFSAGAAIIRLSAITCTPEMSPKFSSLRYCMTLLAEDSPNGMQRNRLWPHEV